ncbi:CRISPR-associated helicase Cas3' [Roseovarius salinarum]|uniref:CRISPR-associated helicase Cas3' n=1 Tax=Roseovarius salinarum TaxID=1981892 RepID=UPI001E5EDA40|nr:CRISPR-associated helicase Cas3' [Roseovarius salinarum]
MTPFQISSWPGKTFDSGTHPALWHMLDVGAVADRLLSRAPATGCAGRDQALVMLVTLHDLGKFSDSFRDMLAGRPYGGQRHWQHSFRLLLEYDARLAELLGGDDLAREVLYAAIAGHHGGPPAHLDARAWRSQMGQIGEEARDAAGDAIEALAPLFQDATLDGLTQTEAIRLSWWLSGQTVLADWIGSNSAWFPMQPPDLAVDAYWDAARERADLAIREAGLFHANPSDHGSEDVLGGPLRPMQHAVKTVSLPDGPTLALIEDATGSGKTEAALILAARLMAHGKGRGIFFALPTMATSNAMLERLETALPWMFDGRPSLALTHGRAGMNETFARIRGRTQEAQGTDPTCSDWLADDRRRVLMADVGVGTVDQALMGVLPTRFNTLRLRALADRILIVDEAHSYDPYMEAELQRLLEFHARLGGSAIVMTATLPMDMRDGFVRAFRRGMDAPKGGRVEAREYPLLSVVGEEQTRIAPQAVPATCRSIDVHRLRTASESLDLLEWAQGEGAACVWVRNAVDEAIEAVEALRSRGLAADLLHARFAATDRLRHEHALQARFGRQGKDRDGRILVATQVVEASLDLDFDLMVSDLAPVGALIQRAGRMWRHMDLRPAHARPVPGPALHVLAPDPETVTGERWVQQVLGPGAWVYPQDTQWRTAKALFDAGRIDAPGGLRALIEAVHGNDPLLLPAALDRAGIESEGRILGERARANNNLLDPWAPYDQPAMARVHDDEVFPTRLGLPQITLRLARRQNGVLRPWADGEGPFAWQMSEVQISAARYAKLAGIDQDIPEIAAVKSTWPRSLREHVVLAPVGEEGRICEGLTYDREMGAILY